MPRPSSSSEMTNTSDNAHPKKKYYRRKYKHNVNKKKKPFFLKNNGYFLILVFIVSFFASLSGDYVNVMTHRKNNVNKFAANEAAVLEIIKSNPKVILDAVISYQKSNQQNSKKDASKNLPKVLKQLKSFESPFIGKKNAKYTIYEFTDSNCGYCKKAYPVLKNIISKHPKIKVIELLFPVLGESSTENAAFLYAVFKKYPKKYSAVSSRLITKSINTEDARKKLAELYKLNYSSILEYAKSESTYKYISTVGKIARSIGINGTPGFIVGKEVVRGAIPEKAFLDILKAQYGASVLKK